MLLEGAKILLNALDDQCIFTRTINRVTPPIAIQLSNYMYPYEESDPFEGFIHDDYKLINHGPSYHYGTATQMQQLPAEWQAA